MGLTRIRAEQISNIDYKQAVRVVTTTNIASLSGGAPSVVDGVSLQLNNRVLVAGQSTASQNGIYIVQALGAGENGTWVRASDANQTGEIEPGMVVMVTEGGVYADTPWKLTTNGEIIIGTTALTFVQFSSGSPGGSTTQIQFNNANTFAGSPSLTWSGTELYVNGTANVTGNVTGNYFFGNGSQLSGIITSVANINNGTSNVDIASANANVTVSVAGTSNVAVFSSSGLTVTGTITGNGIPTTTTSNTAPANPEQGDVWIVGNTGVQLVYFTSGGNSQWAEMEAAQSFSSTGSDYGNTEVAAYLPTYAGNIGDGSGYVFGNGSQLTGLPASYGNANVTTLLSDGSVTSNITTSGNVSGGNVISSGIVSAVGNITGAYILGNGSQLTGIITSVSNISSGNSNVNVVSSGGNVTVGIGGSSDIAVISLAGLDVIGRIQATANVTGLNLVTAGNVSGGNLNVTGNIVDTGALSIITSSDGNITLAPNGTGRVLVSSALSATGNITGNYILGNGSQLTGITGGSSATNGIFVNTSNVSANYTIAAGTNGMSVGPITVNNGVVATVDNGQRWVIL